MTDAVRRHDADVPCRASRPADRRARPASAGESADRYGSLASRHGSSRPSTSP